MAYAKVIVNTNPIPNTILVPKAKSFPSSGGGGSGATNIYPLQVNNNGASMPVAIVVPIGIETDLVSFVMNFTGNKPGLMVGFAAFTGVVIDAIMRLYIDGVKISETSTAIGQSVSWGAFVAITPVGIKTVKITALNSGLLPLPVPSAEVAMLEFL